MSVSVSVVVVVLSGSLVDGDGSAGSVSGAIAGVVAGVVAGTVGSGSVVSATVSCTSVDGVGAAVVSAESESDPEHAATPRVTTTPSATARNPSRRFVISMSNPICRKGSPDARFAMRTLVRDMASF